MEEEQPEKWQSVLLVLDRRLECPCGNLALIVTGDIADPDSEGILSGAEVWCQDCFHKMQKEAREDV